MLGSICLSDTGCLVQVYQGVQCELTVNPDVQASQRVKPLNQPVKIKNDSLVANRSFKKGDYLWAEPYWEDVGHLKDNQGSVIIDICCYWSLIIKIVSNKLVVPFIDSLRCNKEFAKYVMNNGNDKMLLQRCVNALHIGRTLDIFGKIATNCFISVQHDIPYVELSYLSSWCKHSDTPNAVTCVIIPSHEAIRDLFDTPVNHSSKCFMGQALCDIEKGEAITVSFGLEYSAFLANQTSEDVQSFLEGVTKDILIHGKAIHDIQTRAFPIHKSFCVMLFDKVPRGDCVIRIIKFDDNWYDDPCFVDREDSITKKNIETSLHNNVSDVVCLLILYHNNVRYKRIATFSLDSFEKDKHEIPNFINAIGNVCNIPSRLETGFVCGYCSKRETTIRFKRCAICLAILYCGEKCQKLDWKEHKKLCSPRTEDANEICLHRSKEWNIEMKDVNIFRN